MITCTNNNFGAGPVSLRDFQSPGLCVLNGLIHIDPENAGYISAHILRLQLPDDFTMDRSAVSCAYIQSSRKPKRLGTVIRCWIEERWLCMEKISDWDRDGQLTIIIASGFVTRGFRGTFEDTVPAHLTLLSGAEYRKSLLYVNDNWVYWGAFFSSFPSPDRDLGMNIIRMEGFPEDVDAAVPVSVGGTSFGNQETGSALALGRIYGGCLYLEFDDGGFHIHDNDPFLTFFAVRGTMQPASPVIADIHLTEDDVEPGEGTATGTFQLRMSSPPSLCSLDAVISRTGDSWVQKVAVRDYPPAAPDDMQFYLPARTPEDTGYRVVMKETFFSRAESMIFLTHIGTREVTEAEIIGTSLMGRLLSM